jgi:TPR repeat protein
MSPTDPFDSLNFRLDSARQWISICLAVSLSVAAGQAIPILKAQSPGDRGFAVVPSSSTADAMANGNYYALVIGINDYPAPLPALKTAVNDARAVAGLLQSRYGFQVISVLNHDATRAHILNALNQFRISLKDSDSLLVYYAGHGYLDKEADRAYWLPVDAESAMSANRISADDLTAAARTMPSRHVLIISDSCYSGTLTVSRDVNSSLLSAGQTALLSRMMKSRSRNLMASGGNEPVSDNGPDGHSVFASAVLKALEQAAAPMFTARQLFYGSVEENVAGTAVQTPRYDYIRNANHDDGDFVFVQKSAPDPLAEENAAASAAGTRSVPGSASIAAAAPDSGAVSVIRRLISTCADGDARACADAGALYMKGGEGVTADLKMAAGYLRQACETPGMARSCSNLGIVYASTDGPGQDLGRAADYYRRGCDGGDMQGCTDLGVAYADGKGVDADEAQARSFYRKGCDGDYGRGCTRLGALYMHGSDEDGKKALALVRKGCDDGDALGCDAVGEAFYSGYSVEKDPSQAMAFYQKGCDGGIGNSCVRLGLGSTESGAQAALYQKGCDYGDALGCLFGGQSYSNGTNLPKDLAKAFVLFKKGCDGGRADACYEVGKAYDSGEGVEKDAKLAVEFERKSCEDERDEGILACVELGRHYQDGTGVDKNPAKAAEFYAKSCDGNLTSACPLLGILYSEGMGVQKDQAKAVSLYRKACDDGVGDGCILLARANEDGFGVPKNAKLAGDLYRRACDLGNMESCLRLGALYASGGVALAKNLIISTLFYQKVCDSYRDNRGEGCYRLGKAYETGAGIPKDTKMAADAYEKACTNGSQSACADMKRLKQ